MVLGMVSDLFSPSVFGIVPVHTVIDDVSGHICGTFDYCYIDWHIST